MNRIHPIYIILILLVMFPAWADAQSGAEKIPDNARMQLGPVKGLTTQWKLAPSKTMIPLGTTAQFRTRLFRKDEIIVWTGATEISNDGVWSVAEAHLDAVGPYVVTSERVSPRGDLGYRETTRFNVVDIHPQDIIVSPVRASVDPVILDEDNLNESTYEYFRSSSIAALHKLDEDRYVTSVGRRIDLEVDVEPLGFAPLIEWRRVQGEDLYGRSVSVRYWQTGIEKISVGPTKNSQNILLEKYQVKITSHASGENVIPAGEPVTFTAVTDPPGYEEYITWLGSTKFGSCEPVMGKGLNFATQFEDAWGPHSLTGESWQWLGVKADNAAFEKDSKENFLCVFPGFFETRCQGEVVFVNAPGLPGVPSDCPVKRGESVCVDCPGLGLFSCPIPPLPRTVDIKIYSDSLLARELCTVKVKREEGCIGICDGEALKRTTCPPPR